MIVVDKTKENFNKCKCAKCPSYTLGCKIKATPEHIAEMLKQDISNEKHIELMFCSFGKSKCIAEEKGCICTSCAVHKENGLEKMYYCLADGGR